MNSIVLLNAWERGAAETPPARALTLLAAAWPDKSGEKWANASIGERDRNLLRLREELFGSRLEATSVCPQCGERIELSFATQDIAAPKPALPAPGESLRVEVAGYEVVYRLPTSADLLDWSVTEGRDALLKRCVQTARFSSAEADLAALPAEVVKAVTEGMAEADPQAEVLIALNCPSCSHRWSALFDILSFLWGEIEDWSQRLLLEVHTLASAYGWSERDIVAMSARRRRMYLDMVGA